jgi:hypothetical protein
MKTCKYGCGGKMKVGGTKKSYQDGGPTLEDIERKDRRNILGGLSAKLGLGTAGAGIASIAGKRISDAVKKKREGNKEVKGMVKNIVKKAKSTKVMQTGGEPKKMPSMTNGELRKIRKEVKKDAKNYLREAKTKMQMGGYAKPQMGGDNTKMGIYGVPNAGRTDALGFKKGGTAKAKFGSATPVQTSCKKGMVRGADGRCVMSRPSFQKGGFPDLNKDGKVTKADILKGRGVIKKIGGSIKKK